MNTFNFKLAAAALACACSFAPAAQAAGIVNGDFTASLSGWSKVGNVAVDSAGFFGAPPAGFGSQAVLGTAETSLFLSGGSAVAANLLESFSGAPVGTLAGLGATVGSGLRAGFTAAAGDVLSFQWKFMSNEPQGSPANDSAFIVLDDTQFIKLTSVHSAAFVGGSASPMFDETAYAQFDSAPLTAGLHSVAFGIVDVPDSLGASALAVTGVQLAPVPEPGSAALATAGLAMLGAALRRRSARG